VEFSHAVWYNKTSTVGYKRLNVSDEPAQRAASWQTCCKQMLTLSVINLQPN